MHDRTEVFSVSYDPDDKYLACGYGDGKIRVLNTRTGKMAYELGSSRFTDQMPVTAVKWRPVSK